VVAASEPRFPLSFTVLVIGAEVGFVKLSTVRAKSCEPAFGTVTARDTVSPPIR